MNYIWTIFILASTETAVAHHKCKTHKIYCKIAELQPKMDKDRAMKISNIIYREAKAHNIDPMVSIAILNQENRFRDVHTYEIARDVKEECYKTSCSKTITEHHEVVDIGIAQINVRTAVAYNFDLQRLYSHDLEYAIQCHLYILRDKINRCQHLGDDSWSCYHSTTPKYRIKYVRMVKRYL